ncbi:MAG: phosphoglucomutase/phosphomannomutase family protein, partial [Candidatus Acidiferrales bacterium]
MSSQAIHFGTSGWRGIIGDDFTFPRVRRASAAIAAHLKSRKKSPVVLVAGDSRFFSEEFARASAEVLRREGCRVLLCPGFTPTPAVAHAILHNKLDGGVNITASHNPYSYNGLKFSGPEGGPAPPETTEDIENRLGAIGEIAPSAGEHDGGHETDHGHFETLDPREAYLEQLHKMVRFYILRQAKGEFVFDALHGCGAGWLDWILAENDVRVTSLHTNRDVLFDGGAPDPSEKEFRALQQLLLEKKALAGLGTDGDADRYGILDRDGTFIQPNHILALLFDYLLETRGVKLGAVRSVATSHLLDAVAGLHGVEVYETPVGFKYIGPYLRADKIVIVGEESAGLTIRGHLPEKDGILACLLVAEMIAGRKSSLGEQLRDLFRRVGGEFWPVRKNLKVSEEVHAALPARLKRDYKEFNERKVASSNHADGLKLVMEDGAWVLMRPSGTEPVVRVYTESASQEESEKLAGEARE